MPLEKLKDDDGLRRVRDEALSQNRRLVFTNGCFDLLHVGHVRYLQAARALGDLLVVAVNSDASVRGLKGDGRPVNSERDRAEVLAALESVDFVTIFDEPRVTRLVEVLRPQIYAKGGDYRRETLDQAEVAALESVGADIRIIPLVPGKSTSSTIQRLQATGNAPR